MSLLALISVGVGLAFGLGLAACGFGVTEPKVRVPEQDSQDVQVSQAEPVSGSEMLASVLQDGVG